MSEYANKQNAIMTGIQSFMSGTTRTVSVTVDSEAFTAGRVTPTEKATTFTRTQVLAAVKQMVANAIEDGPKACEGLPAKVTGPGVAHAIEQTYTVTRRKGGKETVGLLIHGVRAHASRLSRENRAAKVAAAVSGGTAWHALGVTDNDGEPRAFPSRKKAVAARCRLVFGGDWHAADKASRKETALSHVSQTASECVAPVAKDMPAKQAVTLAKTSGAPTKVTAGTGAATRSREWLVDNHLAS
jgi:hypothetical protein